MPLSSRVSEKIRSSCGAISTNTCASLTVLNGPPAMVVSTVRIAGICFQLALDRPHRVVHRGDAGAFGRGHAHLELRFVHAGRQEVLPHQAVERDHRQHHEDGDRRANSDAVVQRELQHARVDTRSMA